MTINGPEAGQKNKLKIVYQTSKHPRFFILLEYGVWLVDLKAPKIQFVVCATIQKDRKWDFLYVFLKRKNPSFSKQLAIFNKLKKETNGNSLMV